MIDSRVRAEEILTRLQPLYEGLTTGLDYSNPLELLVATILSAQCTDERVNSVTPTLFRRYVTAADYAGADGEELEAIIHPLGFFRSKARSVKGAAQVLVDHFGGEVPQTMEDLITLPGVARKTANVVLSHAFDKNEGIAVDTHVGRVARRLGLTAHTDPAKVEADLMSVVPQHLWGRASDLLIWHGRKVCSSRSPRCYDCVLLDLCPFGGGSQPQRGASPTAKRKPAT